MMKRMRDVLIRRGMESAVQVTTDAAAAATSKSFRQVFEVKLPLTVYVRASHADVKVKHGEDTQVELFANLQASFGWELVAEQDEAGIYIVAKRKLIVGRLSTASFTLVVPPSTNLVMHLTPGTFRVIGMDGKFTVVPAKS